MANGSLPKTRAEHLESAKTWRRLKEDGQLAGYLWVSVLPYVELVERVYTKPISLRDRLYILWYGKLPDVF